MSQELSIHVAVERLQELLSEIEAMPELPRACTPESLKDHEGWMKANERVRRLVYRAEVAALMTVPVEVAEVLNAIEARKRVLLHLTYTDTLDK